MAARSVTFAAGDLSLLSDDAGLILLDDDGNPLSINEASTVVLSVELP